MKESLRSKNSKLGVYDMNGTRIHVGDILEWQETSGAYGQTKRGRGTVKDAELLYGRIITTGGTIQTHWEWKPKDGPEGLYCRHENHTYEHGHKTWARIVK